MGDLDGGNTRNIPADEPQDLAAEGPDMDQFQFRRIDPVRSLRILRQCIERIPEAAERIRAKGKSDN